MRTPGHRRPRHVVSDIHRFFRELRYGRRSSSRTSSIFSPRMTAGRAHCSSSSPRGGVSPDAKPITDSTALLTRHVPTHQAFDTVDLDRRHIGAERVDPRMQPSSRHAEAVGQPIPEVLQRRGRIRVKVHPHGPYARVIQVGLAHKTHPLEDRPTTNAAIARSGARSLAALPSASSGDGSPESRITSRATGSSHRGEARECRHG
jgi:hypothetical protein